MFYVCVRTLDIFCDAFFKIYIWVDVNSSNKMLMIIIRLTSSHHLRLNLKQQRCSAESTCPLLAGFLLSVSLESIPPVVYNSQLDLGCCGGDGSLPNSLWVLVTQPASVQFCLFNFTAQDISQEQS